MNALTFSVYGMCARAFEENSVHFEYNKKPSSGRRAARSALYSRENTRTYVIACYRLPYKIALAPPSDPLLFNRFTRGNLSTTL